MNIKFSRQTRGAFFPSWCLYIIVDSLMFFVNWLKQDSGYLGYSLRPSLIIKPVDLGYSAVSIIEYGWEAPSLAAPAMLVK